MLTLTGTGTADQLFGSLVDDDIRGKGGDDFINGLDGNDKLRGGGGNDLIVDGDGEDRMWGGNGADTFVLALDGDRDYIRDWTTDDVIDIQSWGVTDISQLTFNTLGNGQIRISNGTEEVQIKAKGGGTLTQSDFAADDFVFAPTPPHVIDFEALDMPGPRWGAPIELIQPGYGGMNWSDRFYFMEDPDLAAVGRVAGDGNRTGGGDVFATNLGGAEVWFSAVNNFDFDEVEIGAVYNDGLQLKIAGLDNGNLVGVQYATVDTSGSTTLKMDDAIFDNVDQVVFVSAGGTLNPAYSGQTYPGQNTDQFYIDDLMIA
ncbi:MAG: hypothetical protein AAF439_01080 [Pseudomonadota bacterium]